MEHKIKGISPNEEALKELLAILQTGENIKITIAIEKEENVREEEKIIVRYLNELGIPGHLRGYGYIKYGILRCINSPEELESVTKILYPNIAKKYLTTAQKVEHGIRHAITKAWEKKEGEQWKQIFGVVSQNMEVKPTNSCFLATITDYIRINN